MDDLDLVTLVTFPLRHEAEIVRARLASEGIPSLVRADDEGGLSPGFFAEFGVRIEVRREDLVRAETLLVDRDAEGDVVDLHLEHVDAMVAHATFCAPEEACGLLAFDGPNRVAFVYALTNADRSRHRFTIEPAEHYRALNHAERAGWEVRGSFHSHPSSAAVPSSVDLAAGLDRDWVHVIVGGEGAEWEIAAFLIRDGASSDMALHVR